MKTDHSKFSIPINSLIIPEPASGIGLPSAGWNLLPALMFHSVGLSEGTALRTAGPQDLLRCVLTSPSPEQFSYEILKVKVSVSSEQFCSLEEIRDLLTEALNRWTENTKWMKCFQKDDLLCSLYITVDGEALALHGSLKQNFTLCLVFQMMQGKHFLV